MMRFCLSLLVVTAAVPIVGQPPSACPAGTLFDDRLSGCVVVQDSTRAFASRQNPQKITRSRKAPVPGGIGSGVLYRLGRLTVTSSTNLDTEMIVYPEGLGLPPDWMFTAATNRSESGVEVVGVYHGQTLADAGIFDWSCSPTHPCLGGQTGPSWVRNVPLTSMACNIVRKTDGSASALRQMMRYSNRTTKLAEGSPDTWRNDVYFWNYCAAAWDQVYTHTFASDQRDCSSLNNVCGWWGPIIETFFTSPQPVMPPLGYHNTELFVDGSTATGTVNAITTDFVQPPPEWTLFHLVPNRSWSAGSPDDTLPPAGDRNLTLASVTDTPDPVRVNQPVSYAIAVMNTGADMVSDAVVAITLPASGTYQSSVASQGSCAVEGTVVTCALGAMSGGQMLNVSVVVTYAGGGNGNGKGKGQGQKNVTVTVVADPANSVDETNETDNTATQTTRVN